MYICCMFIYDTTAEVPNDKEKRPWVAQGYLGRSPGPMVEQKRNGFRESSPERRPDANDAHPAARFAFPVFLQILCSADGPSQYYPDSSNAPKV